MLKHPLYLASASPRRHELLNQIAIPHTVVHIPAPPGEDEPQLPNESAVNYVKRTAYEKAVLAQQHLSLLYPNRQYAILCADTTVELNGLILAKPEDNNDAQRMLHALSNQTHHVHTAVVLVANHNYYQALSSSQVSIKELSSAEIDRYCASGEPFGKAGAYGIQGQAGAFVQHLEGSYSGVMGLPLYETYQLLDQAQLLNNTN